MTITCTKCNKEHDGGAEITACAKCGVLKCQLCEIFCTNADLLDEHYDNHYDIDDTQQTETIICASCKMANLVVADETSFCRSRDCRAQQCLSVAGRWFRLHQPVWFYSNTDELFKGKIVSINCKDSRELLAASSPGVVGCGTGGTGCIRVKYDDSDWSANRYDEFKPYDQVYAEIPTASRHVESPSRRPLVVIENNAAARLIPKQRRRIMQQRGLKDHNDQLRTARSAKLH